MQPAMFRRGENDTLDPLPASASGWGSNHMRGMAVSGALARAAENAARAMDRPDLRPTRWTVDLFRVATMTPTTTTTTVVRSGRRLCLIDAEIAQNDRTIGRATAVFLATSADPSGDVWTPADEFSPPPVDFPRPAEVERLYRSGDDGWTMPENAAVDGRRNETWQYPVAIVDDEPLSGFQFAASVADVANAVGNFGDRGLEYVNADVTMSLGRVPCTDGIGMRGLTRVEADGISVVAVDLFDRRGRLGAVTVNALANAEHAVDLRDHGRIVAG